MAKTYYLNRTLCDVLEEMRRCVQTLNFAPLMSLIEEAQIMGSRMDAGLEDKKDLVQMNEEWHELRTRVMELCREAPDMSGREGEEI